MDAWMNFWIVVLVLSLIGFAVLAVVVAIGGFRDLTTMFAEFRRQQESD